MLIDQQLQPLIYDSQNARHAGGTSLSGDHTVRWTGEQLLRQRERESEACA